MTDHHAPQPSGASHMALRLEREHGHALFDAFADFIELADRRRARNEPMSADEVDEAWRIACVWRERAWEVPTSVAYVCRPALCR